MKPLTDLIAEDAIYSQLGRFYTELLFNAELSDNFEEREHAKWMRLKIVRKLDEHSRSYN